MLCDAKLSVPKENAAAKALDEEEDDDADEENGGLWYVPIKDGEVSLCGAAGCPGLGACRRSCSAFAKAFSCVRTKCAKFYDPASGNRPFCGLTEEVEAVFFAVGGRAGSSRVWLTLMNNCPSSESITCNTWGLYGVSVKASTPVHRFFLTHGKLLDGCWRALYFSNLRG